MADCVTPDIRISVPFYGLTHSCKSYVLLRMGEKRVIFYQVTMAIEPSLQYYLTCSWEGEIQINTFSKDLYVVQNSNSDRYFLFPNHYTTCISIVVLILLNLLCRSFSKEFNMNIVHVTLPGTNGQGTVLEQKRKLKEVVSINLMDRCIWGNGVDLALCICFLIC